MQILHIGTGSFFRAHQAWYLSRLIDQGDASWSIIAGSIRNDTSEVLRDLATQKGAYTLEMIAPDGTRTYEKIRSITRIVPFAADCDELVAAGAEANVRIISFTVTEAGYCLDARQKLNAENADLQADLRGGRTSIYGVITAILSERRIRNSGAVTLLNCDNLRHNGDQFKENLFAFLRLAGKTDLIAWCEENTAFPNAMVDRITPRPSAELSARVQATTGFADKAPVMSESFAQWVIEDTFCAGRPAWENAGATLVSSVLPYEEAKIRTLNASHSCFAWYGSLRGLEYIHEGVATPEVLQAAYEFITSDVIPSLEPSPLDLAEYRDLVLRRFSSDQIKDTNQRVAADSYAKVPGFLMPTLRDLHARGKSYDASAFLLALFFKFLEKYQSGGLAWEYRDASMNESAMRAMFASANPLEEFCADKQLFGELAGTTEFTDAVKRSVFKLNERLGAI